MHLLTRSIHTLLLLLVISFSNPTLAAPDGKKLFLQYCSACHGLDGHGGVGVPLALESFLRSVDDQFLFNSIRIGRPGRVMPTFNGLSDAQINAIIHHIRSWAPDSKQNPAYQSIGKVNGDAKHGALLFKLNCAKCHGENGEGGHGTGVTFSRPRDLEIMAPALNNIGFLKSASDQIIKVSILHGREGTPMPAFATKLKPQQIDDIVAFIRGFEKGIKIWKPKTVDEPIIEMESSYSFEDTIKNVQRAAKGVNFRIIRLQNFEEGLFPLDEQNPKQVMVYFCNFKFVNKAINIDPRVGLFMPCRITVVEEDGVVKLRAINPEFLSRVYNNDELDSACEELSSIYYSIMEEATL